MRVCDVLNPDGSFKEGLNKDFIEELVQYFNSISNYKMSDSIPFNYGGTNE